MKKEKHIIQFLAYSKPHIWGVEDVWDGIFRKWTHWESFIFSGCLWQDSYVDNKIGSEENIEDRQENKVVFPDFEIVDNFPVPKIWTKLFWKKWKELQNNIEDEEKTYLITHTRFFLSSFLWGIFAKRNNCTWIHIEHGSDYVKLSSPFKTKIAYLYDKTLWKWVLKKADKVLCISSASSNFVEKEFWVQGVKVWLRWKDIPETPEKHTSEKVFLFIWRLVHLKWVQDLLRAYSELSSELNLVIIWDGEEKEKLITLAKDLWISSKVKFLWHLPKSEVLKYLSEESCIVVNPSYQEWMPTTVIEWLMTKNVVVATDVWWTSEISNKEDLILTKAWDVNILKEKLQIAETNYENIQGGSYNSVRKRFSWDKSLEALYNHF